MSTVAKISLRDVSIEIPVFNATSRSLTSKVLNVATGGRLDSDARGRVKVQALKNINLELNAGDRLGLLGHNGSGKTTLLRTVCGAYKPTSGVANLQGSIGSLIDISLGINPEATGRENLFIRGSLLGISRENMKSQIEEIIDFSELGDFVDLPVRTYSSGMNLRLAFAVSTAIRPEILVMDEWLSVGDEGFRHKAEARLEKMVNQTKILVLASHSRELIEATCNRAIWLEHGQIKLDGPAKQVTKAYFGE